MISSSRATNARRSHAVRVVLLALAGALEACAFSAVKRPTIPSDPSISQVVPGVGERLFDASRLAIESMGFGVAFEDRTTGLLNTKLLVVPVADNCDCGTWNGRPVTGQSDLALTIRTAPAGTSTSTVTVQADYSVRFTGRNLYGQVTRDEFYRCRSLGRKEQEFLDKLRHYLASGS